MRVYRYGDFKLDVPTIVAQMDQATWALKSAMDKLPWAVMFTSELAMAADARVQSLQGLIRDLDVGGVAREHVFFPLEGQTSEQAWATYREVAEYVQNGIKQLGGFVSQWSLTPTLSRIASDVKNEVKTDTSTLLLVGGGLLAVSLLAQARRGFAGYSRRRRRR